MLESNLEQMEKFNIEDFQKNFDEIMERVENGESFVIKSAHGNAIIVPFNEVVQIFQEAGVDDDVIRIHTDHEEGS